ncbi:MAG: dimethyl sulfoxide reductase anchor subunit [Burkholderiales bacterium]|nr:dimethyl sulfoxide reductase anchor subunit [Burkholderiales bacterium]
MNPAFSVIFLTTLIGAAQGLFLTLFAAELAGWAGRGGIGLGFFALGGSIALLLTAAGLAASFAHLGRPERAWRAAAMWRTSWLSREVIVLPLFMAGVFFWTLGHFSGAYATAALGTVTALLALVLFVCTAMIYASIRFLQEWASAYTLANYTLLGLASGSVLASALAGFRAPALVPPIAQAALALTASALLSRSLSLARNARLVPRSTVQSAIGVRHPVIRQRAMGFMGGSFNTREFFHGLAPGALRQLKWWFLAAAFALPAALVALVLWAGFGATTDQWLLALAFAVQYVGLLIERWFFFAQARHPQNLYYQAVA